MMATTELPSKSRSPSAARIPMDEDLYDLIVVLTPPVAKMILKDKAAKLGSLTQHPTSDPAVDVQYLDQLRALVQNPENSEEGVLQNVTDFIATKLPREFHLFAQKSHSQHVTMRDPPSHPMAVAWKLNSGFPEAIIGENPRSVVTPEHITAGGHLRGVVRIIATWQGGFVKGSGVLIDEFTVATVGHLLIDRDGHARNVVIRVSEGGGDESRNGTYAAVHYGWYSRRSNPNDLAFIRLSKPFETVKPIKYMQTPVTDKDSNASIYGYPGDMPNNAKGNQLCVSKSPIRYSQSYPTGMLEHKGDTEKGTSGGPILDASGTIIALHRGWDHEAGGGRINQAVAIDRDGNDFWAFDRILKYMHQGEDAGVEILGEVRMLSKVKNVGGYAFAW
ncbi:trypsin-like cysteine/serine peptidase domain-containing protein [Nemania sp. NC0429]|nr:trypsin-like cysteine/serine peptidase domain-containing protein [Nemania sp. NC0429]